MGLKLDQILAYSRIGLDTNLFIYTLENNPDFEKAISLFKQIPRSKSLFFTSVLTFMEFSVLPYRDDKVEIIANLLDYIDQQKKIVVVDIDKEIALRAAQLRAKYNLKTPDALHLATVVCRGCQIFVTADRGFSKKIEEIIVEVI